MIKMSGENVVPRKKTFGSNEIYIIYSKLFSDRLPGNARKNRRKISTKSENLIFYMKIRANCGAKTVNFARNNLRWLNLRKCSVARMLGKYFSPVIF